MKTHSMRRMPHSTRQKNEQCRVLRLSQVRLWAIQPAICCNIVYFWDNFTEINNIFNTTISSIAANILDRRFHCKMSWCQSLAPPNLAVVHVRSAHGICTRRQWKTRTTEWRWTNIHVADAEVNFLTKNYESTVPKKLHRWVWRIAAWRRIYEWGCRKIRISWLFKECWSVVSFKLNVGSTWTFNFQHNPADFIWSGALPFNFLLKPSFNVIPSSPVKRSRNYKMNRNPYRRIGNCRSQ